MMVGTASKFDCDIHQFYHDTILMSGIRCENPEYGFVAILFAASIPLPELPR